MAMNSFRNSYLVSVAMLGGFVILSILYLFSGQLSVEKVGFGLGALGIWAVSMIPLYLKGGVAKYPKLAFRLSVGFAMIFGAILGWMFIDFVRTDGGEGPNGEGSPLTVIIALVFFSLFFFCPWLIAALQGFAALRANGRE